MRRRGGAAVVLGGGCRGMLLGWQECVALRHRRVEGLGWWGSLVGGWGGVGRAVSWLSSSQSQVIRTRDLAQGGQRRPGRHGVVQGATGSSAERCCATPWLLPKRYVHFFFLFFSSPFLYPGYGVAAAALRPTCALHARMELGTPRHRRARQRTRDPKAPVHIPWPNFFPRRW